MNTIETERLLLRPWKIDDAAEAASLFRYASDPERPADTHQRRRQHA